MIRRAFLLSLALLWAAPAWAQLEAAKASGTYAVECHDAEGNLKWRDVSHNLVVNDGKNLALNTYLAGAGYTATGPYMGLIATTGFAGISASDTMTSHAGWLEAGAATNPQYTGPRKTAVFNAASGGAKVTSARLAFTVTVSGNLHGAFLVYGPGAVATIDNTGGTLYSASVFTGGSRVVMPGDTISILYTASL